MLDRADAADAYCYTSLFRITKMLERHNGEELPSRNNTVEKYQDCAIGDYFDGSNGAEVHLQFFNIIRC